jgi:acetoin utilization deacetylase AcuC-like enzyme
VSADILSHAAISTRYGNGSFLCNVGKQAFEKGGKGFTIALASAGAIKGFEVAGPHVVHGLQRIGVGDKVIGAIPYGLATVFTGVGLHGVSEHAKNAEIYRNRADEAEKRGHHALAAQGMGFCLVANAVVAARHGQRAGRERVLIVDWDVHHGNGTQALVEQDPTVRFVSLHQHPWYPGTGMADERGVGNVFNVPRGPGAPPERYVADLWAAIVAATAGWTPDLVLVSAGFDAMLGDPLGGFTLEPAHYADLTRRLRERLPGAPIAGLLEGGYVPGRLADGALAHLRSLA